MAVELAEHEVIQLISGEQPVVPQGIQRLDDHVNIHGVDMTSLMGMQYFNFVSYG